MKKEFNLSSLDEFIEKSIIFYSYVLEIEIYWNYFVVPDIASKKENKIIATYVPIKKLCI